MIWLPHRSFAKGGSGVVLHVAGPGNALAVKLAWLGKIDHLKEGSGPAGDEGDPRVLIADFRDSAPG